MSLVKRTHDILMYLRFLRLLLWEFRWSLCIFWGLVFVGGLALMLLYRREPLGYVEACYEMFSMAFLQSSLEFPHEWYLQPFFFIVPMIGLGAVADSLVRLGYMVFAQKSKLPEWQQMMASLHRNHIVVVGVGKVGFRIVSGLLELGEQVVAIDIKPQSEFLEELAPLGVPVICGSGRNRKTLENAGVAQARSIILATDDDLANLDSALTARELRPDIRVVLRLFDETLATKFADRFDMPAVCTSHAAAPAFIAAATGRKVYHAFKLDDAQLHLTDVTIAPGAALAGRTVGEVQEAYSVNFVMHRAPTGVRVNPAHGDVLAAGDTALVIAPMRNLVALEEANRSRGT